MVLILVSMRGSRGGGGGRGSGPSLKNHKNIGFLSNTGMDPLKNHKPTKQAFNIGPLTVHQRNAIDGPLIVVSSPYQLKKKIEKKKS